jgi:predicted RNA-binding protein YlxR (DUF448 family)
MMMRIARLPDGSVSVQSAGRRGHAGGRGAYICPDSSCVNKALGGDRLRRALKAKETVSAAYKDRIEHMVTEGIDGQAEGS